MSREISNLKEVGIGTDSTALVSFRKLPIHLYCYSNAKVTVVEAPVQLSRAQPHIEHAIGESVSRLLIASTYLAYLSGTDKAVSLSLRDRYPGYDGLGEE